MKWINADQQVTVNVYNEEHEEYLDKIMTVEQMLDAYTDEGCPTIYANPEPKTGHWISQPSNEEQGERPFIWWKCSNCGQVIFSETQHDRFEFHAFCGRCGAKMFDPQERNER